MKFLVIISFRLHNWPEEKDQSIREFMADEYGHEEIGSGVCLLTGRRDIEFEGPKPPEDLERRLQHIFGEDIQTVIVPEDSDASNKMEGA